MYILGCPLNKPRKEKFLKSFCSQSTVFCVLKHSVKGTASVLP